MVINKPTISRGVLNGIKEPEKSIIMLSSPTALVARIVKVTIVSDVV
jgi:hypothetical protein